MDRISVRVAWTITAMSLFFALGMLVAMIARSREPVAGGESGAGIAQQQQQQAPTPWALGTPAQMASAAGARSPISPAAVNATPAVGAPSALPFSASAVKGLAVPNPPSFGSLQNALPAISAPVHNASVATPTPAPSPTPDAGAKRSVSGKVTDLKGRPVANAIVKLAVEGLGSRVDKELTADSAGKFSASGLNGTRLASLIVEAPGFAKSEPLPATDLPLNDLEVSLQREPAAEIKIMVAREMAAPAPYNGEATVYVYKVAAGSPLAALVAENKVTIQGGRQQLRGLEEDATYKAAVAVGNEYAEGAPFKVGQDLTDAGQVLIGERQSVSGVIKSSPEQEPIAAAHLSLMPVGRPASAGAGKPFETVANEQGKFELTGVPPGNYQLTISALGFKQKKLEAVPVPGGTPPAPAAFFLSRTEPSMLVNVRDAENQPLKQVALSLVPQGASGGATMFGESDAAGTAHFEPLPPGKYILSAALPGKNERQKQLNIELKAGEEKEVPIVFARTVRVSGHVTQKKKPYEGRLTLVPCVDFARGIPVRSDASGSFSVDLEPGDYLAGDPRKEERSRVQVSTEANQLVRIEIP